MRLKEKFERKHIHSWKLSFRDECDIERHCSECDAHQHARLDRATVEGLPQSCLHLADADWRHGPL